MLLRVLPRFVVLRFGPLAKNMLLVVGRLMMHSSWLIKGLAFDGHHSHGYMKDILLGSFMRVKPECVKDLKFWGELEHRPLPQHCLPHLPLQICFFQGESLWCIGGPCG